MKNSEYDCQDACRHISEYYKKSTDDRQKEMDNALRALNSHIFKKKGKEIVIECHSCYLFFVHIRGDKIVVPL